MKKTNKNYSDFRIKALSLATAITILATYKGFTINREVKALLIEQNDLLQEEQNLLEEYQTLQECEEPNYDDYRVEEVREVDGRTIYIVSNNDTEEEVFYLDPETEEYQLAEDGVLRNPYSLEFATTDFMVSFYSKVFQLDEDTIKNKINELIEESEDWDNNVLNGQEYNTQEEAIARVISDISENPQNYDLVKEEIETEEYLLSDFYPEELIYKFSNVIGVNPNIALAIAYLESGKSLDSYNFTHNYNVAGIHPRNGYTGPTTSEGYVIYKNQADGLFRFVLLLRDEFGVTMDSGTEKISSMASTFCEIPDHWRTSVTSIYNELEVNGYDYEYNTYNYQDRDLVLSKTYKKVDK